jgi:hypothetical protein
MFTCTHIHTTCIHAYNLKILILSETLGMKHWGGCQWFRPPPRVTNNTRHNDFVCLSVCAMVWSSISLYVCLPAYLPACMPACLHASLPACQPACMPACLHGCFPISSIIYRDLVSVHKNQGLLKGEVSLYR